MTTPARNVRTYSRRSSMKTASRKASQYTAGSDVETDVDSDERPSKKRAVAKPSSRALTLPSKPGQSSRTRLDDTIPEPVGVDVASSSSDPSNRTGKDVASRGVMGSKYLSGHTTFEKSHTPSPSKLPKDLSDIFDSLSSQSSVSNNSPSPSRTPRKTKQMLGRSRTESSIEDSPSRSLNHVKKSSTFANSDSITKQEHVASGKRLVSHGSLESAEGQQAKRPAPTLSRTYAGQSRSFLVAVPISSIPSELGEKVVDALANEGEEDSRDSYSDLRRRWGIDNPANAPILDVEESNSQTIPDEGLNNALFSISDLRSKGESRRFMDEAGYLFEGFDPSGSLSVWRSAALDLIVKLLKPSFWKKAKAADFIEKIWELLGSVGAGGGDKILDPILSCFVFLLKDDPRDIVRLSQRVDFKPMISKVMSTSLDDDLLGALEEFSDVELAQKGIKRVEKSMLTRLRNSVALLDTFQMTCCQPSMRILLSTSLATTPSLVYPSISVIVRDIIQELAYLSRRISAYITGLPVLPDVSWSHNQLCLEHACNGLQIIDSYLVDTQYGNAAVGDWDYKTADAHLSERLVNLIAFVDAAQRSSQEGVPVECGNRCSEFSFRILINLTHENKSWCESIARQPALIPSLLRSIMTFHLKHQSSSMKQHVIKPEGNEQANSFDRLCLALGVLTNVVHEDRRMAKILQESRYSSTCAKNKCFNGCTCQGAITGLACLCSVYTSLRDVEDAYTTSEYLYIKGHLALLLGLLCSSTSKPHTVLDHLLGLDNSEKLEQLIGNISEFSSAYAQLTRYMSGNSRVSDNHTDDLESKSSLSHLESSTATVAQSLIAADVVDRLRVMQQELFNSAR